MANAEKLTLHRASGDDFEAYYRLKCDPEAIKWSGFASAPDYMRLKAHFKALVCSDKLVFFLKDNDRIVGYCQISTDGSVAEVDGYSVLSDYTGKGYGTRLLAMVIDELRASPCGRIIARVSERNLASIKCFSRNGFTVDETVVPQPVELKALERTDNFITVSREIGPRYKVAVITAARSEYGLLRWFITDMERDADIDCVLIVAGAHLSPEQGMTVNQIIDDGHKIAYKVDFLLSNENEVGVAKSNGRAAIAFADVLGEERPDIVVVLGDRYELLGICSTAMLLGIPIAHISGGDITEGAIDNQVRNAVTMMADIHFPGTQESAANIARMRGGTDFIYNVGEPGLDSFIREKRMTRAELAESLNIDPDKKWILCTLHPETRRPIPFSLEMADNLMAALKTVPDAQVIVSAANVDAGGEAMNDIYKAAAAGNDNFIFVHSLGHRRYLSFMNEAWAVVGNSSSGIVEAPFLGIPVINIGSRQQGRHICTNVVNAGTSYDEICRALAAIPPQRLEPDCYFGDGHTSARIKEHIKDYLRCFRK